MTSEKVNQIASVRKTWDEHTYIHLTDGTVLELSDDDIEMLEMSFMSECEACGFDPNADPFEDEDEEYEDDQVFVIEEGEEEEDN